MRLFMETILVVRPTGRAECRELRTLGNLVGAWADLTRVGVGEVGHYPGGGRERSGRIVRPTAQPGVGDGVPAPSGQGGKVVELASDG
jgi:hypothetical protein